jgi:GNAT superfamily N-acetyltransferase
VNPTTTVRTIRSEETYPLRHKVLRPSQVSELCPFDFDDHKDSFHLGAFKGGLLVGILSAVPLDETGAVREDTRRIRGMAVDARCRGRGIGSLLLQSAVQQLEPQGPCGLWCFARSQAVPFYVRNGFVVEGEEFEIEGVGPHFTMILKP